MANDRVWVMELRTKALLDLHGSAAAADEPGSETSGCPLVFWQINCLMYLLQRIIEKLLRNDAHVLLVAQVCTRCGSCAPMLSVCRIISEHPSRCLQWVPEERSSAKELQFSHSETAKFSSVRWGQWRIHSLTKNNMSRAWSHRILIYLAEATASWLFC